MPTAPIVLHTPKGGNILSAEQAKEVLALG